MDVDHRDKLIQIVKERGPVLPNDVHRELKTNTLFASAMLSELVDSKILRISNLKIGGSPLYYVPGQEVSLQNWANKLHEKEQRAFELLRTRRVIRDIDEDPLVRACLRQIKDFSIPLEVNYDGQVELFWKWYLISNDEAEPLIKQQLNLVAPQDAQKKGVDAEAESPNKEPFGPMQVDEEVIASGAHGKYSVPVTSEFSNETGIDVVNSIESVSFHVEFGEKGEGSTAEPSGKRTVRRSEIQESLMTAAPKPLTPPVPPKDDAFYECVMEFFAENSINVSHFEVLRKNSEIDVLILLPSQVGLLHYCCKAKNKQKISEGDVSAAYVHGQLKKLPILFLTTGELSKKAAELASREFKSMFIKHLKFEKKKNVLNNSKDALAP